MNEPNPEWVPAEYETAIATMVTTKEGVAISLQAVISSKDSAAGMRAHQAIHDFLQSL